jgi:hypothetical protein
MWPAILNDEAEDRPAIPELEHLGLCDVTPAGAHGVHGLDLELSPPWLDLVQAEGFAEDFAERRDAWSVATAERVRREALEDSFDVRGRGRIALLAVEHPEITVLEFSESEGVLLTQVIVAAQSFDVEILKAMLDASDPARRLITRPSLASPTSWRGRSATSSD